MFARTYLHLLTHQTPFGRQRSLFRFPKAALLLIKRAPFADQKDSFHFLPPFGRGRGGFFSKNTSPPPRLVWNADKHRGSGRGGVAQTPPLTPPPNTHHYVTQISDISFIMNGTYKTILYKIWFIRQMHRSYRVEKGF